MQGVESLAGTRKSRRSYWFVDVAECNMCGASGRSARVLGIRLDKSQGRNPRANTGAAVSICSCAQCGLIFANPQPIPASISDHYGVPPESYWKSVAVDPEPGYFQSQVKTAQRLLDFHPGMKAIDIGIGIGKAVRVMREAGFDVHGIEPSAPFFRRALEVLGRDEERFKNVAIEEAIFEEGAFDFVSFGAVLEHVYDPSGALLKAMSWLKPGGILHAEVPNANHLVSRVLNAYYRLIGTTFITNTSPMHVPYHLYEFTLDSFNRNGQRNGYAVVEHAVDVASIYNIPQIFHPVLRTIMSRTETGMQLIVWLRRMPSAHQW
jgi:SAM-dependent methyltransferase